MQMMYINATHRYGWKKGEDPCEKEPSLLLDPDVSLDIGSKFDCLKIRENNIESSQNIDDFIEILKEGFRLYNQKKSCYGKDVVNNAKNFKLSI